VHIFYGFVFSIQELWRIPCRRGASKTQHPLKKLWETPEVILSMVVKRWISTVHVTDLLIQTITIHFCISCPLFIIENGMYVCMLVCYFRGGLPHALRPLYGLLYVPLEFQISRHTLPALVLCSPHLPENSGTYSLAPSVWGRWYQVPPSPICWRNWMLCLDGKCPIILLKGPLGAWGPLTCSKFTTQVKQLKVPPGGLVPWIFPSLKIRRPPPGFNPHHSSHEVGTLPLDYGGRAFIIEKHTIKE
jgi:hypothetical protein